jgi:hypothetical protein
MDGLGSYQHFRRRRAAQADAGSGAALEPLRRRRAAQPGPGLSARMSSHTGGATAHGLTESMLLERIEPVREFRSRRLWRARAGNRCSLASSGAGAGREGRGRAGVGGLNVDAGIALAHPLEKPLDAQSGLNECALMWPTFRLGM